MTFDDCHRAIKKGDAIALRRALELKEIEPNLANHFSWTMLMLAALEGNTTIAELLLERGAAVNARNDFGESALTLAAHKGHLPLVHLLLNHGASPDARPHGHDLQDWLTTASGLSTGKIGAIMEAINSAKSERR